MSDTAERILAAASDIVRAGDSPSVRAVAARAGVGVGTLRHHFPTQRALMDAVLSAVYAEAMPDRRITDPTIPAVDRLVECLQALLVPFDTEADARDVWRNVFRTFVDAPPSDPARSGYAVIVQHSQARVEAWLRVLSDQGALARGDDAARARFLLTVVNGLAIERIMPAVHPDPAAELTTLRRAVEAVLGDVQAQARTEADANPSQV